MSKQLAFPLADAQATVAFGGQLAQVITNGAVIYLHGDLGAGKTTFSRGVVQGFGHTGKVKSPTYTLVEVYELAQQSIYHFDLYRLSDPEELEFMGIRDYFSSHAICLVEWPEKGQGMLPPADVEIVLEYQSDARLVKLFAHSQRGQQIINNFNVMEVT